MTFSISFPSVLRKMIGWNDLRVLYVSFWGFGIMTDIEALKWLGQKERLIQVLAS